MEPAGLNRLKAALQPGDCVKVVALSPTGRLLTEVLERLGWLRENQVEVIILRESIDQDSAMGPGDAAPQPCAQDLWRELLVARETAAWNLQLASSARRSSGERQLQLSRLTKPLANRLLTE